MPGLERRRQRAGGATAPDGVHPLGPPIDDRHGDVGGAERARHAAHGNRRRVGEVAGKHGNELGVDRAKCGDDAAERPLPRPDVVDDVEAERLDRSPVSADHDHRVGVGRSEGARRRPRRG